MKDPLQTLVSRDQYETAYAVLAHFLLLAQRAPSLFSQVRAGEGPAGVPVLMVDLTKPMQELCML